jgi:hypothetical protein
MRRKPISRSYGLYLNRYEPKSSLGLVLWPPGHPTRRTATNRGNPAGAVESRVASRGRRSTVTLICAAALEQHRKAHERAEYNAIFHLSLFVRRAAFRPSLVFYVLPVGATKSKRCFPVFRSTISDTRERKPQESLAHQVAMSLDHLFLFFACCLRKTID